MFDTAWILLGAAAIGVAAIAHYLVLRWQLAFEKEARLESFVENMAEGYYRSSLGGEQLTANPALVRLNGYDNQEEMLAGVKDIATEWYVDPQRRTEFSKLLNDNGKVVDFVSEVYRHKTRERIWISENARLVCDKRGLPLFYEGTVREITDTVKRLELEDLHRKLTEQVPGALFQVRWDGGDQFELPYRSPGLKAVLKCPADGDEPDHEMLVSSIHPDDIDAFCEAAHRSAENLTPLETEFRWQTAGGETIWLAVKAGPQREDDGSCLWHGHIGNVTERKEREQEIYRRASFDDLTGLSNRTHFLDLMEKSLRRIRRGGGGAALFFIDIDNFKMLNDTRGHSAGDALLKAIAGKLQMCVEGEGVVGRFGGDEFTLLLDDLGPSAEAAQKKANRIALSILKLVDQPIETEGRPFHTTCSIGVRMIGEARTKPEILLKDADTALYAAKEGGRNRVVFYDEEIRKRCEASFETTGYQTDAA